MRPYNRKRLELTSRLPADEAPALKRRSVSVKLSKWLAIPARLSYIIMTGDESEIKKMTNMMINSTERGGEELMNANGGSGKNFVTAL